MRLRKVAILTMSAVLSIGCMTGCGMKNNGEFDSSNNVTVVSREAGSGTRGAFVELFGVEKKDENGKKVDRTTVDAITSNSTSVMMTTVAGDLYGIGYISVSDDKVYEESDVSGKIVVAGSSSVTPVMEKLKEGYEAVNSDVEIEIQESDSTTGVTSTIEGICDIGMASRDLKDSEIEQGITGTVIAMDGIAVIVNNDSVVEELSVQDVMNIYIGEAITWSDVISE